MGLYQVTKLPTVSRLCDVCHIGPMPIFLTSLANNQVDSTMSVGV